MVDFLVIGPRASIICGNIFPLVKDRRIMLGSLRKDISFGDEGISCRWFQNIRSFDVESLPLKKYKEGEYDYYDHFDAINTEKVEDIPDCDLVIGVPVSFIDKWDYRQFDIVDARDYRKDGMFNDMKILSLSGWEGRNGCSKW